VFVIGLPNEVPTREWVMGEERAGSARRTHLEAIYLLHFQKWSKCSKVLWVRDRGYKYAATIDKKIAKSPVVSPDPHYDVATLYCSVPRVENTEGKRTTSIY